MRPERPFAVGPLVNVYNERTLGYLARLGARRFCLPPELPIASVGALAKAAKAVDARVEVWAYGRIPLAISSRCAHARIHGLSKDSCQFVCAGDPDGLAARTLDGADFLAVNGVQTLSHVTANLIGDCASLAAAGVGALRLSPHTGDFVAVTQTFADAAAGRISGEEGLARLGRIVPDAEFSNGFLFGDRGAATLPGAEPSRPPSPPCESIRIRRSAYVNRGTKDYLRPVRVIPAHELGGGAVVRRVPGGVPVMARDCANAPIRRASSSWPPRWARGGYRTARAKAASAVTTALAPVAMAKAT